jgi:hypothetical protein
MIENPAELKLRVAALIRDTAKLHTAAGIGFVSKPEIVESSVKGLAQESWNVVDVRASDAAGAQQQLGVALKDAKKPLVVVVNEKGPMAALLLAQAVADKKASVDLGDRQQRNLPENLSLVVVIPGVDEHHKLPRQLQAVNYWELIHGD